MNSKGNAVMSTKRIAVMGATGAQGGGLVRSILAAPGQFTVRAITRKPTGPAADALRAAGAEVAAGDSDDTASLAAAFGPIRDAAIKRFWIDDLFEGVYNVVLMAFSRVIGWIDRYLVDGVLNVVSAWTLTSGDDLRTLQTGRAQDYVYGVAVGLLMLLLWARWALA